MRRQRFCLTRLALVFALFTALLTFTPVVAHADAPAPLKWPEVTAASRPYNLISDLQGGVILSCGSYTAEVTVESFDASGVNTRSIAASTTPKPYACDGQSAVSNDGTLYALVTDGGRQKIVAYQGNNQLWVYDLPCSRMFVRGIAIGTDGNIYVAETVSDYDGTNCNSGTRLIGIDPTQLPASAAAAKVADGYTPWRYAITGGLAAFDGGLIIRYWDGVEYFDYTATSSANNPITHQKPGIIPPTNTTSGRVFIPVQATSTQSMGCWNASSAQGSIDAYEPSGRIFSFPLVACTEVLAVRAIYNGGMVAKLRHNPFGTADQYLLAIAPDGKSVVWSYSVPVDRIYDVTTFAVDINGNVAVQSTFNPQGNANQQSGVKFHLLNGNTGDELASAELSAVTMGTTNGYQPIQTNITIADGVVYTPAHQCNAFGCFSTVYLYAVKLNGVMIDYPRGAILKAGEPWKNYVALGDSFSSGEGVEPFESSSDVNSTDLNVKNVCHRSAKAYPRLLDGNPTMKLRLSAFVACSGAVTDRIDSGWPPFPIDPTTKKNMAEAPQDKTVGVNTDIVSLTIGGNDVGFGDLAAKCVFLDCTLYRQQFFDQISVIDDKLGTAYNNVLLAAPNAWVYVVGYPQLIPAAGCPQAGGWMQALNLLAQRAASGDAVAIGALTGVGKAAGLTDPEIGQLLISGHVEFSQNEAAMLRDFVSQLDAKIQSIVAAKNQALVAAGQAPRMIYVDPLADGSPFIGHELCTSVPYFNGLDVVNVPYSFHPKALGQDAYLRLIQQNL